MSLWLRFRRRFITHAIVLWDGWQPICWSWGWCVYAASRTTDQRGWCFHIERVYIRPKYRGWSRKYMREMLTRGPYRWADQLQLVGIITRIRADQPGVIRVGQRWGGYVPYHEEGGHVWCSVTRLDLL